MISTLFGKALWRRLHRRPTFSLAVILTIALAIAANTALFSVVHAVILSQLPFEDAETLVWIWNRRVDRDKAFFSIPDFIDFREQTKTLKGIGGLMGLGVNLGSGGDAERVAGLRVTANFFEVLGTRAVLGRAIQTDDGRPGFEKVVVLTHGLWKRQFGGAREIVGKAILMNGESYVVLGVLPPKFFFPGSEAELAVPLVLETDPRREARDTNFIRVVARRNAGASVGEVEAEMGAIAKRLREMYAENAKKAAPRVLPLQEEIVGDYRKAMLVLWAAVALVLLVACTNLAGLFLAQVAQREYEIAIRSALGASRGRLIGEMLAESVALALVGGIAGIGLAAWGTELLMKLSPTTLPRMAEIGMDGTVLAFSVGITLVAGLLLGAAPAIQYGRGGNAGMMRTARTTASRGSNRLRQILVVSQVALATVLCLGAGWMVRSYQQVQAVDPGLETRNLLLLRLSLPVETYKEPADMVAFLDRLFVELEQVPGVKGATAANFVPLSMLNARMDFQISGRAAASPTDIPGAQIRWVMPEYFKTMGIPVKKGREFVEGDTGESRGVAVVDEALARAFFSGEETVGRHLVLRGGKNAEIVGVAGNVKHFGLEDEPLATLYLPIPQTAASDFIFLRNGLALVVRTEQAPLALAGVVRQRARTVDSNAPASGARTMEQLLAGALGARRFNMQLMTAFAIAAMGLAAMGLYGVMAYSVEQTRREIGVRLALGAQPGRILRGIVQKGAALTGVGIAIGLVLAVAASRVMEGILFRVRTMEPGMLAVAVGVLLATMVAASYFPGRRAAGTDPVKALRGE